ncbi:MAG TPA: CHRD domain-containing protein [Candidatus Binatia bacterium]|nr:CHRD domain-containing protein [Candidatus Binatia bacterium]
MPHARRIRLLPLLLLLPLVAVPAMAGDDHHGGNGGRQLRARLTGFHEVPSVSTVASGEFTATIAQDEQSIEYELTYSGLQGTVQQAHIHVAQRGVNGSIVIWLCGTTALPGPAGTPACPPSGTVGPRTVTAADVIVGSMPAQQLAAGELNEVIAAIRAGVAYANVHTDKSPGGEIRGQIRTRGDH